MGVGRGGREGERRRRERRKGEGEEKGRGGEREKRREGKGREVEEWIVRDGGEDGREDGGAQRKRAGLE